MVAISGIKAVWSMIQQPHKLTVHATQHFSTPSLQHNTFSDFFALAQHTVDTFISALHIARYPSPHHITLPTHSPWHSTLPKTLTIKMQTYFTATELTFSTINAM